MKKYTYESIAEDLEAEAILYIEMQGYEVIYDD